MGDGQETLSFVIEAHDKATQVFRSLGGEVGRMTALMQGHLRGLSGDVQSLARQKPVEIIRAEQIVAVKAYERQLAALNAEARTSGKVTDEQAAKMTLLRRRIEETNAAAATQARSHHATGKAADIAAVGVLGLGAGAIGASVKAAVSFDNLQRSVATSTGLSGKSLDQFMGTVRKVSASTEFDLGHVAQAAQVLRVRFGETGDTLAKNTERMLVFSKVTGQDAGQAVTFLDRVMRSFHVPASQVNTVMDQFLTIQQHTQKPAADLEATLARYSPTFQAMGMGFQQSLTYMGAFQKAGVDAGQVARGLSKAVQAAQKEIAPSASTGVTPMQKYAAAVKTAEEKLKALQQQTPHTTAEQAKLRVEIDAAAQKVTLAKTQYDQFNTTLQAAGGAHASVASIIQVEMRALENAKTPQDRLNAAVQIFGGRAGPAFARALDQGKVSLQEVSQWLTHSTGAVDKAGKTVETSASAQWAKLKNEVHDLAITIGQDFLPALTGVLHVVGAIVQPFATFVKDNKTLAEVMGGGAMAGAAGLLLSRHTPLGGIVAPHMPGGAGGTLGQLVGGPGAGTQIFGVTGTPMRVGSMMNPIMVRIEGALGGGGGLLPGGPASKAEQTAARDAGLAGQGAATSLLGRAGAAGAIYLIGQPVGQAAGSAIDGKSGAQTASGAVTGAAVGTMIMPGLGTAAGAILGAGLGASSAEKSSDINNFTKGIQAQVKQLASSQNLAGLKQLYDYLNRTKDAIMNTPGGRPAFLGALQEVINRVQAVKDAGVQIQRFDQTGSGSLKHLADQFQTNFRLINTYIGQNTQQGQQLAQKNTQAMIAAMLRSVDQGKVGTKQATDELLKLWRTSTGQTKTDVIGNYDAMVKEIDKRVHDHKLSVTQANEEIRRLMVSKVSDMRSQVTGQYKQMFDQIAKEHADGLLTDQQYATKKKALAQQESRDVSQIHVNLAKNVDGTYTGMSQTVLGAFQNIETQLNKALTGMGLQKVNWGITAGSATGAASKAAGGVQTALNQNVGTPHHATGGRVPGPVGPDTWTLLDPSGRAAAMVGGGELLVANRHTEAALDFATQAVYGRSAGEMVAGETTPHSAAPRFATGGRVVTASEFGGHNDPSAFNKPTASGKIANDRLWGYAELSKSPGAQDFSALGHLPMGAELTITKGGQRARAPKVDVGAGGPGIGGHPRAIDLTYAVARAVGLSGLGLVTIGGAGGTTGPGPGGGGGAVPTLHTPHITGGTGPLADLGNALAKRVTDGANQYLQKHAPAPSAGGGGGGGGGAGAPTLPGQAPGKVDKMLHTAESLIGAPYVFGGHGPGYDCSSAISKVINSAGFNVGPTTDQLKTQGVSGKGNWITWGVRGSTGANAHTMMMFEKTGTGFEEGGGGPQGKRVAHWTHGWDGSFDTYHHLPGLATGGFVLDAGQVARAFHRPRAQITDAMLDPQSPRFVGWGLAHGGRVGFATGGRTDYAKAATDRARAMWRVAAKYYGEGSAPMPPLDLHASGHLQQILTSRGWEAMTQSTRDTRAGHGGGVTFAPAYVKALAGRATHQQNIFAADALVHEWTHSFQHDGDKLPLWRREGGAEAFRRLLGSGVFRALGWPYAWIPAGGSYPQFLSEFDRLGHDAVHSQLIHGTQRGMSHALGGRVGHGAACSCPTCALGGRQMEYAGAFQDGGIYTATGPTMAIFGERGPETAIFTKDLTANAAVFVPPVTPTTHKSKGKAPPKQTSWVDPKTNKVVHGTSQQHHAATLQHQQQSHQQAAQKKQAAHPYPHEIFLGGGPGWIDLGPIDLPSKDAPGKEIDISGPLKKMKSAAWTKVSAAVLKAIQAAPEDKQLADVMRLATLAAKSPHDQRLKELLGKVDDAVSKVIAKRFADLQTAVQSQQSRQGSLATIDRNRGVFGDPSNPASGIWPLYFQGAADLNTIQQLQGQEGTLKLLLANAVRSHNTKLAASISDQLAKIDDFLLQTQADYSGLGQQIKDLETQAMQKVHDDILGAFQNADTFSSNWASATSTIQSISDSYNHILGIDDTSLQNLKQTQGGSLTPGQIAQANQNLTNFITGTRAQETPITGLSHDQIMQLLANPQSAYTSPGEASLVMGAGGELGTDLAASINPNLTPAERQNFYNLFLQAVGKLGSLEGAITDQTKATKDLTTATTNATPTFGGSVGYSYQNQDYVVQGNQSSSRIVDIGHGV